MPSTSATQYARYLILLLLLVAALYAPGLAGPFFFDDGPALTGNPFLRIAGGEFDDWRTASMSSRSGPSGRPLAMLSFTANYFAAGGMHEVPVKLVNLLLHLMCGVLVFFFAREILRRTMIGGDERTVGGVALLATALWLLAPLQVSTVLYAVQRMTVLATLFALAGLVLFLRRRERWAQQGAAAGEIIATGLWLALLTLLAVLCKENGILLLWLLAVLEVSLFRGRWAGRERPVLAWLGWAALLAPFFLLALWWTPETLAAGYAGRDFTLQERVLTQLRLLWQYLGWMVWPDISAMGFQHDDIPLSQSWLQPVTTLVAALAWLAVIALALLLRRRAPLILFALLFYLVGHVLESSFWPLEMVYEHRNYLPSVGVFILLAVLLSRAMGAMRNSLTLRPQLLLFAVLAVCATLLLLRVTTWADPLSLSTINAANHPLSSRSQFFLAQSQLRAYQSAREAGVEHSANHLLLARHHFELMYQNNPRDIAAIVMLYYLDQHHLPELQQYHDWFAILEELARDRPLQASDITALETLVDCFIGGACGNDHARLLALFDGLQSRYPRRMNLAQMAYRLRKSVGAPLPERLALLNDMRSQNPKDTRTYQYLLQEYAAEGDVEAQYETVKEWMHHDPARRYLGAIRRMFAAPGELSAVVTP